MHRLSIFLFILISTVLLFSCKDSENNIGKTVITKWQNGKRAAISITYDDATINQFRQALPIMDSLGFKGTFFINTADIPNSKFAPKWIGRSLKEIVKETARRPTDTINIFERASALRFLDLENSIDLHNKAGALYESGKVKESLKTIDSAFALARKKKSVKEKRPILLTGELITWPEIKDFAKRGHEFGNHTISHPRLAVLDEPNLLYEIEKCKEEIYLQLGTTQTFSAECPFGTENERVMNYAYKIHPALRNRMPESFLEEINRSNNMTPYESSKEYIQWQRGPLQKTTVATMKSWVDTLMAHDNVWLVLTFHGIDGIGWEAKPHDELKTYFSYMKDKERDLWIATFGHATKYMRERMSAKAKVIRDKNEKIVIELTHVLDTVLYKSPLTLKTYIDPDWKGANVKQGIQSTKITTLSDEKGKYIQYQAKPNKEIIEITELQ